MTDWHLQTTTYRGFGGQHYYGRLEPDDYESEETYELERSVYTLEDALALGWSSWQTGDMTTRFNTYEEVIAEAKRVFLEVALPGDVLYRGIPFGQDRDLLATKLDTPSDDVLASTT